MSHALDPAESMASECSRALRNAKHSDPAQTASLARAAHTAAHNVVQGVLTHHPEFHSNLGPTVPAALETAIFSVSFASLAQELEDAWAPSNVIVDFRREWRQFHGFPDSTPGFTNFYEALEKPNFGAAAAFFVDRHATDLQLIALVEIWISHRRGRSVMSEPGRLIPFLSYCSIDSVQRTRLWKQCAIWPFVNMSVVRRLFLQGEHLF
jgi:hypothetical protein